MNLDPRLLRILLAVARKGSFSRAAASLNMTQPSVSIAISQLEDRVGEQVVTRERRGAALTLAGETLVRHAQSIENVLATAGRELSRQRDRVEGPLTIGGTTGALFSIVPRVTGMLHAEGVALDLSVMEAKDEDLPALLRRRIVELVLCAGSPLGTPADIEEFEIAREPFVLVAGPTTDLPAQGLTVEQASAFPWVLPLVEGATRRHLEAVFIAADVPLPRNIVRCDMLATMKEVVRQTRCVALLPLPVVEAELESGLMRTVPLAGGPAPRRLVGQKIIGEPGSPMARRFLEVALRLADGHR